MGGLGMLRATVCAADSGDRSLQTLLIRNKWENSPLDASLVTALSRQVGALPPCLWNPLGIVSCTASFPRFQISCFQAHSLRLFPSSMLLSEMLLIACSHYLNEQWGSESVNGISMFFLLVLEQHELYPCSVTAACPSFPKMGEYSKMPENSHLSGFDTI